jgi:SAM-dependent methyltransferase
MADQGTEGLLSPWLRRVRFAAARPYLRGKVLDYGCGTGGLAEYVKSSNYLGVEIDAASHQLARAAYPNHVFITALTEVNVQFDTIVSLAVIEHVNNPIAFLEILKRHLAPRNDASIVITTPHPKVDWVHDVGSSMGLFSQHANEEHEDLLDKEKLIYCGKQCGLELIKYKRFLLGANQLAVFRRSTA